MKAFLYFFALAIPSAFLSAALSAKEPQEKSTERVAFEQYCFWTGEMMLGRIQGVIRTEAGFFQGHEVTLVDYDPTQISLQRLARQAQKAGVGDRVHLAAGSRFSGTTIGGVPLGVLLDGSYRPAPASDQKKQMQGTEFARLDLTPEEATKVNAFIRTDTRKALESIAPAKRTRVAGTR